MYNPVNSHTTDNSHFLGEAAIIKAVNTKPLKRAMTAMYVYNSHWGCCRVVEYGISMIPNSEKTESITHKYRAGFSDNLFLKKSAKVFLFISWIASRKHRHKHQQMSSFTSQKYPFASLYHLLTVKYLRFGLSGQSCETSSEPVMTSILENANSFLPRSLSEWPM